MKILKVLLFYVALTFTVHAGQAQTILQVNTLEEVYKACAAKSTDLVGCGSVFHIEMINVLENTFTRLSKTFSGDEKKAFDEDFKIWAEERDIFYKDLDYTFKRKVEMQEWEQSMQSVILDEKTRFLKSKIFALVRNAHKFE
jgi:hypothetical protein